LIPNTSLITYYIPSTFRILLKACEKSKWREEGTNKVTEALELYGWRCKERERALRLKAPCRKFTKAA